MGIMRTVSAGAFRAGRAWSASFDMTNVRSLIAVDTANVLMGNVFVPEDTQEQHATKVRKTITTTFLTFPSFPWEEILGFLYLASQ